MRTRENKSVQGTIDYKEGSLTRRWVYLMSWQINFHKFQNDIVTLHLFLTINVHEKT